MRIYDYIQERVTDENGKSRIVEKKIPITCVHAEPNPKLKEQFMTADCGGEDLVPLAEIEIPEDMKKLDIYKKHRPFTFRCRKCGGKMIRRVHINDVESVRAERREIANVDTNIFNATHGK